MQQQMSNTALITSVLSLLVAALALFLTQFRPPRISLITGSTVGLNYQKNGEGWSLYVPITFSNSAHAPGLINRCSLVLMPPNAGQTVHYIEWTEFRKRDEDKGRYVRDEFAGPVQVEGRSSISKLVWFKWRTGEQVFSEGKYEFELILWKENEARPAIRQKHSFYVDTQGAQKLGDYKMRNAATILFTGLDKQIESNKQLTQHELLKLLS
jgi:hypothetical protein